MQKIVLIEYRNMWLVNEVAGYQSRISPEYVNILYLNIYMDIEIFRNYSFCLLTVMYH